MQKLDVQIPEEVLELVNVIQRTVGPEFEVTLAGGFLRDSYGNAPIKDIDIIVTPVKECALVCPEMEVYNAVQEASIQDWFCIENQVMTDYIESMKARNVSGLIMGQSPNLGNFECQLIIYGEHKSRAEVAADMDINICQVVMGPDGVVWATESFVYGFHNKVLTVLNGQDDEREAERIQRMLKKYPDFKVTNQTLSDLGGQND